MPTWRALHDRIRRRIHGLAQGQEPGRARVPSGREGSGRVARARPRQAPRVSRSEDPRAHRRAGARDHVPRALGGRQGRDPGQPRLPHPDEQRHRPVQGRPALPPVRQPRHPQVPRLRADLQELADDAAHGRRQGRLGLRPQGQERQRSHALLPELHDRAVPPHRPGHRRARRRHRRGRPRDRLHVRPVQEAAQRVHRRAHRQGPQLGRLAHPSRGDRLRRGLLRRGDAHDARRDRSRARRASSPAPATWRSTRSRRSLELGGKVRHAVRLQRLHLRRGRHRRGEARRSSWSSRTSKRGRIKEYAEKYPERGLHAVDQARTTTRCGITRPTCAFPCATQNEINGKDAANLVKNGVLRGRRRRQHADRRPRASNVFLDEEHPLRSRQGRQCRRRGHLGPRDVAEQHAPLLDARGSRRRVCTTS